jgi:hypothetical protein
MRIGDPKRFRGMVAGVALLGLALALAVLYAVPTKMPAAAAQPHLLAAKTPPAVAMKPLTEAERQTLQELRAEQKRLDTDSARVMAATPDGRQRVTETIAKHFNVPEKAVTALRSRKMSYGEVAIAMALAQQVTRREKTLTQPQAADKLVSMRKSGQSWGVIARDLGLKLGDAVSAVKKADKQLEKMAAAR